MIKIETLQNATCNYADGEQVDLKNKKYIIIDANDGYIFNGKFTIIEIDSDDEEYEYNYEVGKNGARLFYMLSSVDSTYIVRNVIATKVATDDPDVTNKPKLNIVNGFTNCTCNYENGTNLIQGKPLIFTANEGYIFNDDFHCNDLDGSDDGFLNRSSDNKTVSIDVDDYITNQIDLTITSSVNAVKEISQLNMFTNLYKVSDAELVNFSSEYIPLVNKDINVSQFIKKVYKFPLKIVSDDLSDKDNIKVGVQNYNTKGTIIDKYQLTFDLGNITVKEKYHNVYDYLNTHCILHLPFFPSLNLDAEYVINQTIHIIYIVDMYSGVCNALISSSFIQNNVFYEAQSNIVQDMPIVNQFKDDSLSNLDTRYINDLKRAYLEIKRNIPYNVNNDFGKPSLEITTLEDKKGYIKVDDIQLESKATIEEKDDIIKNVKNGITIL